MLKYFAAIGSDGLVYGLGLTESGAKNNALVQFDSPKGEIKIVEITKEQSDFLMSGNRSLECFERKGNI